MEALLLTSEDAAGCLNIGHSKVYDLMRAGATRGAHLLTQLLDVGVHRGAARAARENAQWATNQ